MKWYTEYLSLFIPTETDFVNITHSVEEAVRKSGIQEGLCLVNAMHVSSSVFVHNASITLDQDQQNWINWMQWLGQEQGNPAPLFTSGTGRGRDDVDPSPKRQALGREVVVAITEGRLDFGPSEQVFYGEFDGKRPKRVLIKIIGE
jgi:secondary thiamine-phosphate synthase enzyme